MVELGEPTEELDQNRDRFQILPEEDLIPEVLPRGAEASHPGHEHEVRREGAEVRAQLFYSTTVVEEHFLVFTTCVGHGIIWGLGNCPTQVNVHARA